MAGEINHDASHGLAAPGGHYSHAVSTGGLVFVSGQLPIAPDGTKLSDRNFEQQARQALANVAAALASAATRIDELVQVRVYVTDINDWPVFDRVYAEWIGAVRPARAVVPVPALHYGFRIEIEAVASVVREGGSAKRHPPDGHGFANCGVSIGRGG
jgi:2-iminobutanoate/2-iminopropanoate deaminase